MELEIKDLYKFSVRLNVDDCTMSDGQIRLVQIIMKAVSDHVNQKINPVMEREMGRGSSIVFLNGSVIGEGENTLKNYFREVYDFNIQEVSKKRIQKVITRNISTFSKPQLEPVERMCIQWLNRELSHWNEVLRSKISAAIAKQHAQKCKQKSEVYDFVRTESSQGLHSFLNLGKHSVPKMKVDSTTEMKNFCHSVVGCLNHYRRFYQRKEAIRSHNPISWLKLAILELQQEGIETNPNIEIFNYYKLMLKWWPTVSHNAKKTFKIESLQKDYNEDPCLYTREELGDLLINEADK